MALQKRKFTGFDLGLGTIWSALDQLSPDQNLLVLGGRGSRQSMVALSWDEVPWESFLQESPSAPRRSPENTWTTGHLAVVAYDDEGAASRAFRMKRTLIFDHETKDAVIYEEDGWEGCAHHVDLSRTRPGPSPEDLASPRWQSSWTDAEYQNAVRGALEDIRRGRYYQINLLRYWSTDAEIPRSRWLQQLAHMGGPFSAFLDLPDLKLVSFSPERFFRLSTDEAGTRIESEPIKGTRPVSQDPREDRQQQEALMASSKDAAELNMIVDLLRNDLFRVCQASSVKVLDPGSLHSFSNVHHRIARIQGLLRPGLAMGELLKALCPGGSITGAPKREVMLAIREKESRPRGLFMGNIVYKDAWTGVLDSSILIRTAVHRKRWEFAAGSGLVIHSDPAEELAEILTKARVMPGVFL
ncbi:MAG TPA: chorismate-binding protein [Oligoflexus sp.]|uniref:chorismate-binding protein n=1 Tax=Oligoflexus sp. TaxID=1971216 RepID=UPI002D805019|nr:chorismate-binding protein [Oligoflexus sp.]HET9240322.1 chorismate-binding protein [Oligoflexus sp.]